jgi:hypothetical protein
MVPVASGPRQFWWRQNRNYIHICSAQGRRSVSPSRESANHTGVSGIGDYVLVKQMGKFSRNV